MKRILMSLAVVTTSCSAPSVSVMPFLASNSLDGSIASSGEVGDVSTDLGGLGVGDAERGFGGRLDFIGPGSQWSISHVGSNFAGDGTMSAELKLGDATFEEDVEVATTLDLAVTSLLWTYNFGLGDTAHFGLGLGVTSLGITMQITDKDTGVAGQMDETLPIPLIGLRLGGDVGPVRVEGTYSFLKVDVDEGNVSVTDMDVYAGLDVLGDMGTLVLGYREFAFDANFKDASDSANLDLQLGGPYFGVRFSF
jgi:hypothetical protein